MRYLFILFSVFFTINVNAQSVITDTLQGNETVNFEGMRGASQFQALCTQLGGTSDGTLLLQGSVNGSNYVTISTTSGLLTFFPNDTLTITDGAVWLIDIKDNPFRYYRVVGAGTSSDTTLITITWVK